MHAESFIEHDGIQTCYMEAGDGPPIILVHGSGPGVSALANWRGTLQSDLVERYRLIAPDIVGFGKTITPKEFEFSHEARVNHLIQFLDAMDLDRVGVVGNSMGGALALALAYRNPERVERMVLMGAVGISFPITEPLDEVWGYEPSIEAMKTVIKHLAYDQSLVSDDLVKLRYEASLEPGVQERYARAFAAPRQRHIDEMALSEEQFASIKMPTLIIHGVHDGIVPLEETSLRMVKLLPDADLLVFGRVGHWTQIERAEDFQRQLDAFFAPMR